MENQYVYTKKRSEFGRQCIFNDEGPKIVDNLLPNKALIDEYILRDPVHRGVQCSKTYAEHDLNTIRAEYDQHSMNHAEGGWPKDINPLDIEQTMRFRKKVEKDEMYIHTVLQLSHPMEHCIFQNNAVNIYELYFTDDDQSALVERSKSRTVNVFRDPSAHKRPIHHLSWSPDGGSRLAVTHCNLEFQRAPTDLSTHSYIWQVENPNKPELVLQPTVPLVCLEYNPKDPHSLVSGLYNGQVAFFDTRRGGDPVELSSLAHSHRDPTHQVLWINSKSGTEFFSASSDGQVKWWDVRKLNEPMETLILDMTKGEEQSLNRALGASCLEYEPTIPTRFMIGTENGIVIAGNRKGKTPQEKLGATYKTHHGPIYALQRNPAFVKNFLTIGDWTARIWSEDCKESSIIWTSYHRSFLTGGSWSPTRYSVFYTTRMDGTVDAWDILQNQREACLSVKVCDEPLRCLRCHEYGELVAVGNDRGTAYLVEFSENLAVSAKNDKALLTAMFERESRREKIIEGKMREIRLRVRTRQSEAHSAGSRDSRPSVPQQSAADIMLRTAEEEFFQIIDEEEARAAGQEPEISSTEEAETVEQT
uniref:Dynein intermediate chain 3, ciliary n=1 Tax=Cuerna arida TaxID=1464854 RepID=A0A1B6H019_9HEMI